MTRYFLIYSLRKPTHLHPHDAFGDENWPRIKEMLANYCAEPQLLQLSLHRGSFKVFAQV
jgi:hypothetical protein